VKIIEIIVSPTGQTRVETKGFTGAECQRASEFLERALGAKLSERLTPEFYHQATAEQQVAREGS
jgi:Protein of unknown function (DUF2997)